MGNFTEQEDQWLRDALHDVSSPTGLRERIRHRLRQEAAAHGYHSPAALSDSEPSIANVAEPLVTVDQPKVSLIDHQQPLRSGARRRQWIGWALALSVVALMVGVYRWSLPFSVEQLAQHSLAQLDQVLRDEAEWRADFEEQLSELSILNGQLRGDIRPLGYQDRVGGSLADSCRVWKLHSNVTDKSFYVFDFHDARSVRKLTSQLQSIKKVSGGWSLVAMRTSDRVVVVLFEGPIESYLYRPQSA